MASSWARSLTRFARTRSIGTGAGARVCCSEIHLTRRPPPISEYTAAIGSTIAVSSWKGGLTGPVWRPAPGVARARAGTGTGAACSYGCGRLAAGPLPDLYLREAHERARGGAALVARGDPVPDLRPFLAGQQRGRVRRPAGGDIGARLPGVAGGGRHLAVADHALSRSRLGLRRLGLPGGPSRARHHGRPRRAGGAGGPAGHAGAAGPGAQPHQQRSPLVRGRPVGPGSGAPQLLRVG